MLWGVEVLVKSGISVPVSLTFAVGIGVFLAVAVHTILLINTWFGKVPILFAGASMAFSQNILVHTEQIMPVIITLAGGLILSVINVLGEEYMHKKMVAEKGEIYISS